MNALKNAGLVSLIILLSLSLVVFGLAFMLDRTVLNPDFLIAEIDKVDVAAVVEDTLSEEMGSEDEFMASFAPALLDTISELEPMVKEQVGAALYPVFDYLEGRSQSLDLKQVLAETVLSPDFITAVAGRLDVSVMMEDFILEQFAEQVPEDMTHLLDYLPAALEENEPFLQEQFGSAVEPMVGYLLGQTPSFSVEISVEPVIEVVRDEAMEDFLASPPEGLSGLTQQQLEAIFEAEIVAMLARIPTTMEIDESMLGTDLAAELDETLGEVEDVITEARQYVGYFQLGYKILIGFLALLVLGIVLLNLQVRGATRRLGFVFLTYGALMYAGTFVARYFANQQLEQLGQSGDVSLSLQSQLAQLPGSIISPLGMFSLGLLIGGVVLVVVSFVYRRREAC